MPLIVDPVPVLIIGFGVLFFIGSSIARMSVANKFRLATVRVERKIEAINEYRTQTGQV